MDIDKYERAWVIMRNIAEAKEHVKYLKRLVSQESPIDSMDSRSRHILEEMGVNDIVRDKLQERISRMKEIIAKLESEFEQL